MMANSMSLEGKICQNCVATFQEKQKMQVKLSQAEAKVEDLEKRTKE